MAKHLYSHRGQLSIRGAIGDLKFTVGKEELKSFTAEQHRLKAGGFPYFEQVFISGVVAAFHFTSLQLT